jgi:small multidrug resistance family-3 protein
MSLEEIATADDDIKLPEDNGNDSFHWTLATVVQAIALFCLAGVAEIGGGWLVWKAIRNDKPWWWALVGSAVLVVYGFLPTLQPTDSFGRIYAVYGGFFICLSFLAGWGLDGDQPDLGDVIGGVIAMVGVLLILFWPR